MNDLTARLARPGLQLGRLTASDYRVPPALLSLPGVQVSDKPDRLGCAAVIIATAAKWATVTGRTWPWAIIDEDYQMRSDMLLVRPGVHTKFPDGWETNQSLLAHLSSHRVRA